VRNSIGTVAEISRRGLPMPRMMPSMIRGAKYTEEELVTTGCN
jgi:hypothetical protein